MGEYGCKLRAVGISVRGPLIAFVAALLAGCMATKIVTVPAHVAAKTVRTTGKVVSRTAKAL